MCKFVEKIPFGESKPDKYRLLLVPRDSYKTTIGTVAYSLWLLTKFTDLTILISSEVHEKSKTFLSEIKAHIEMNDIFRKLYGNLQGDMMWKEEAIIISTRKRPNKTPTIATTGVGGSKTSQHFDVMIIDDVHSEHNYKTPNQRKLVIDHISALLPLLRPHGFILTVGTRWHLADAFQWIIQSFPHLKTLIRSWKNKGKLYFPGKLTENFINIQKKILTDGGNSKLFYAWYENNPISDEVVFFQYDWRRIEQFVYLPTNWDYGTIIQYGGTPQETKRLVKVCGVIDPADSEASSADFTGVTMKGIDSDGTWWVFYARRLKDRPMLTIKYIVELSEQYKVATWGVETTGGRKLYRANLQEAFLSKNLFSRVIELKSGNRAKADRISGITPRFESKSVIIQAGETDLIEELDYPEVDHDDVIDSLAYHNLMDIVPPVKVINQNVEEQDPYFKTPEQRRKEKEALYYFPQGRDKVTGY